MKLLLFLISALAFTQIAFAGKRAHKAHVHGEGKMNLAVEGKTLEIEMEIPAMDIVGFEHKPKSKKQKQLVKTATSTLQDAGKMIFLPDMAKCKNKKATVETSLEGKGKHHDDHHDHHDDHHGHDKKEEVHSEFHVSYKFKCDHPEKLTHITLNIFKSFSSLKELKGQAVTKGGQFAKELTSKRNRFSLIK